MSCSTAVSFPDVEERDAERNGDREARVCRKMAFADWLIQNVPDKIPLGPLLTVLGPIR
jgi:hypothetical protein